MTGMTFFMPNDVAKLVLGYMREEGYTYTYKTFIKECPHLRDYVNFLKQGIEFPLSVGGITLDTILREYTRLKSLEDNVAKKQTNTSLLLNQLQTIAHVLKYVELEKKQKVFVGARTKKQNNDRSPQKASGSSESKQSSARVVGHSFDRLTKSPNLEIESNSNSTDSVINVTTVSDVTCNDADVTSLELSTVSSQGSVVNGTLSVAEQPEKHGSITGVPNSEKEEGERLQELLEKNSPNPKLKKGSSLDVASQPSVNSDSTSAVNKETVSVDKQTADDHSNHDKVLGENNETSLDSQVKNTFEKTVTEENDQKTASSSKESEILPFSSVDKTSTSSQDERESPPRVGPRTPQKPETCDITSTNTCDSWLSGGSGVKGGDKLLEKFGIQKSSSTDSSDQEVVEHMQAPVTPTKSQPDLERGLVTPVKQLQVEEQSHKSPRRKKPKTPRKRTSDFDRTHKRLSDVEKGSKLPTGDHSQEPQDDKVHDVIQQLIHDEKFVAKISEISQVVRDHRQNRSHHKSGEEHPDQELTAEELETITASKSLEEILETESLGQDLHLDLSDPVFEGLFKLFGTDKEAFHENLRREKHKTDAMEAEVEELEKSIHEEMAACGTLIHSQGDEGYETQRTPDNIYGSPKPSCSGHTGTLEMSSPISQPYTPHSHLQDTSYTSSPRENPVAVLPGNQPVHSPIHPCSPYSNQTDMFSPSSQVTNPFSPALSERSVLSVQPPIQYQPSTPGPNSSVVGSPLGDKTLEPESPYQHGSMKSPAFMPSSPHIIHQNPPQSPSEIPPIASRRTPIPCSPLVQNDIQPSTPQMVQRYNTPFTPQSKHKAVLAAGTVRHLFSPQMYSPTTQQNARDMIQTNLENGVPQYTQEVEVNATVQTGTQTSTNQSINYTNFVSGVNSADSRSTPINIRSMSVFHGDVLTTIDNAIGCISLPPSQNVQEMPPPQEKGKGKGKKGTKGKEKKTQKKPGTPKAQQGGFSTLIGLLSKPPQLSSAVAHPTEAQRETTSNNLSMPLITEHTDSNAVILTEQRDPGTVVLNASDDDIHNETISILSPGGENLIEVPILRCQDAETNQHQGDIVSQAMSQSNVISEGESVCVWSQNLATSTQLTIFSPPAESIDTRPNSDTKVIDSNIMDLERQVQNNVESDPTDLKRQVQSSGKKSSKKKLNLDSAISDKKQEPTHVVVNDNNNFCQPGDVLIAEPLNTYQQKKIFMRNLNFGPNASKTKGALMPSRIAAKGSALVPLKKSSDKSSEYSTVSVNITDEIKYRKIMPKTSDQVKTLQKIPVMISVVPTSHMSGSKIVMDNEVPSTSTDNHYDSDTISCGSVSPIKRKKTLDKVKSRDSSHTVADKLKSENNNKETKMQSKVSRSNKTKKDGTISEGEKLKSPKSKTPCKNKPNKKLPKQKGDEVNKECNGDKPKMLDERGDSDNILKKSKPTKKSLKTQKFNEVIAECDKDSQLTESGPDVNDSSDLAKDNQIKVNNMSVSPKGSVKVRPNSKTSKGNAMTKNNSKYEKRTEETVTKKVRKKNDKPLKVKFVSSKAKPHSEKSPQFKAIKSGNKIFMKSPVLRDRNKLNPKSNKGQDSDSDEDIPLNILQGLHRHEKKTVSDTPDVDIVNDNGILNKDPAVKEGDHVTEVCPRTPEKGSSKSQSDLDTPSKEQVLEKLGLTPKKNAEDILQNLQSPSRHNIIDLLVQLTPVDRRKTPRRKMQNYLDGKPAKSPCRSEKTPAKRLFGSPDKVSANKDTDTPCNAKADLRNKKSDLKCDSKNMDENSTKDSNFAKRTEKDVVKTVNEKHKSSMKTLPKNEKEDVGKKGTLDHLKKEGKKVTPLKLQDLFKNTKVPYDRNIESKINKKRRREGSEKDLDNEILTEKPAKKARNSLDLSVLDYEKMMAKLSKIHK